MPIPLCDHWFRPARPITYLGVPHPLKRCALCGAVRADAQRRKP